jgi:hypothetical protein
MIISASLPRHFRQQHFQFANSLEKGGQGGPWRRRRWTAA